MDAGGKRVGFNFTGKIWGMTTEAGSYVFPLDVGVALRQNGLYIGMTGEAGALGNLCRIGRSLSFSPKDQEKSNNQQKPESSFHI